MKESIKEKVKKKKLQIGIQLLNDFPEEIIEKAIENYTDILIKKTLDIYPEKIAEKTVENHADILIKKMLDTYPEMILKRTLEFSTGEMVQRLLEDYPQVVAERWLDILPEMVKNKEVKELIFDKLKEYLQYNVDLQNEVVSIMYELKKELCVDYAIKFDYDLLVSKIAEAGKEKNVLIVDLIRKISDIYPDSFIRLLEKVPQLVDRICQEIGENREILIGGVGKVQYNPETKLLTLQGYCLPMRSGDRVEIYLKNELIGIAENNKKRPDVYEKYPNYHNLYSGWEFHMNIDITDHNDEIEIRVNRDEQIIKKEIKKISILDNNILAEKKSYYIDLNYVLEVNVNVYNRVKRFNKLCVQMERWFEWDKDEYYQKFLKTKDQIVGGIRKVEELLLSIFCDEEKKVIHLVNAEMEYQDIARLWTIINELLLEEEYYFETDKEEPFIIDGGANIGLAIYYFKDRFPKSKILAFEPSEEAFLILKRNIERNAWNRSNVKILPYALDAEEKEQTLYIPINDCLGASLTKRPYEYNEKKEVRTEKINTKVLNDFINSKVDFLKLDVEGMETRIIKKLGNKLELIENIFLEYHYGNMVEDNNLLELLGLLEQYGMKYQLTKSPGFSVNTAYRALRFVGQKYSLNIWAKRVAEK